MNAWKEEKNVFICRFVAYVSMSRYVCMKSSDTAIAAFELSIALRDVCITCSLSRLVFDSRLRLQSSVGCFYCALDVANDAINVIEARCRQFIR